MELWCWLCKSCGLVNLWLCNCGSTRILLLAQVSGIECQPHWVLVHVGILTLHLYSKLSSFVDSAWGSPLVHHTPGWWGLGLLCCFEPQVICGRERTYNHSGSCVFTANGSSNFLQGLVLPMKTQRDISQGSDPIYFDFCLLWHLIRRLADWISISDESLWVARSFKEWHCIVWTILLHWIREDEMCEDKPLILPRRSGFVLYFLLFLISY